jgi:hypothetical protein
LDKSLRTSRNKGFNRSLSSLPQGVGRLKARFPNGPKSKTEQEKKMSKKETMFLLTCAFVLSMLVACGGGLEPVSSINAQVENAVVNEDAGASTGANSVADAIAENSKNHDDVEDYVWDSSQVIPIVLNGNSITVDGDGVTVDGSKATITSAGTYSLSGSLTDGQIIVNTKDEDIVRLILDGVNISSATSAPIYVMSAEETVIVLADNAENYVSDGESYIFADPEEDEPNAAIFSKDDLTIYGNSSLTVNGNFNDGLASKDGLIITSGTITVSSVDDGIRGKDYLVVKDGNITLNVQGDGLKSDNDQDDTKGYISIETGIINITSGGDAIQAQTDVLIADGEFILSSGGGSNSRIDASTSAKGIKAGVNLNIDGGTMAINSADDAIHSNGSLVINGGTFVIATGDDALHADATLEINGGEMSITDSFEGLESAVITINGGDIHITSSDDGLNVVADDAGFGMVQGPGPGGRPGRGGMPGPGGMPGQDAFTYSGDNYLYINGGYMVIEAAGDGIDVNGAIEMTDGVVIVNGPTERMNSALDYMASFKMTGGFLVAAGSVGMAQAPDASSTQYSVLLNFNSTLRAGTLIHVQTGEGHEILTFSPTKPYQSIALSSPELVNGETYDVYYGGSSTGTANDGLYQDGTYTSGTKYTSFTISDMVTRLGDNFIRR